MYNQDNSFIEPAPESSEHSGRRVKGYGDKPYEFEEVLSNPEAEQRRFRDKDQIRNFRWLYLISSLLLLALLGRGAFLQVLQSAKYRGLAEGNRLRSLTLTAPRGIIYDRFGHQLVENVPSYQLVMIPVDVPKDDDLRQKLFGKVSKLLKIDIDKIEEQYSRQGFNSFNAVPIADNIAREDAMILESHPMDYPGITAKAVPIRKYTSPKYLAHFIGYVGDLTREEYQKHPNYELTDQIGKSGIETSYDNELRGANGAQTVEVDAMGQVISVLGTKPSQAGSNLKLSIDLNLQKQLHDALEKAAARSKKKRAAAVAINPENGEILALVSIPSFDVNQFARGIKPDEYTKLVQDPDQPLFDRPLSGTYSPGSTFKPFVASGALAAGNIDESTSFFDTGVIEVGGQKFRGWKPGGHGRVNVISAIANSVNGFFFSIGGGYQEIKGLGIMALDDVAQSFGFGQKTGIDLPGESIGLLPTPTWKKDNWHQPWYLGDTYNASIGQGFVLVTPLQLANATAAIANGGDLWWPHIGLQYENPEGQPTTVKPRLLKRQVSDPAAIEIVRRGMRATVAGGTGRALQDLPVKAAGKTGTAQFGTGEPHAWFTAFAPYDHPTIALAILVEEAGEGSDFSVPVAKQVLNYYFSTDNNSNDARNEN